jgi:two-component system cell cycle sensor histidine kinase/response regulator CckA
MFNLVINARDAMPSGGRLKITTGGETLTAVKTAIGAELRPGPWAFVSVEDSGAGIDPALQARIFEPFFTTKGAGGSGLGLVTVLTIARENGGGLLLDSAPGRGARFTVYFPEATGDVVADAARPSPPRGRSQPANILVVEDNPPVRDVLEALLVRAGHTVTVTCDGRRALAEIEKPGAAFNLLCCDAVVPLHSARGVIDAFEERFPGAPVLVVSGHVQEELTRRGIEEGRYHMLSKPFAPATLDEIIERLVGRWVSTGQRGDGPRAAPAKSPPPTDE